MLTRSSWAFLWKNRPRKNYAIYGENCDEIGNYERNAHKTWNKINEKTQSTEKQAAIQKVLWLASESASDAFNPRAFFTFIDIQVDC